VVSCSGINNRVMYDFKLEGVSFSINGKQ